jgi:hypothetical protein
MSVGFKSLLRYAGSLSSCSAAPGKDINARAQKRLNGVMNEEWPFYACRTALESSYISSTRDRAFEGIAPLDASAFK